MKIEVTTKELIDIIEALFHRGKNDDLAFRLQVQYEEEQQREDK